MWQKLVHDGLQFPLKVVERRGSEVEEERGSSKLSSYRSFAGTSS